MGGLGRGEEGGLNEVLESMGGWVGGWVGRTCIGMKDGFLSSEESGQGSCLDFGRGGDALWVGGSGWVGVGGWVGC